jgi:hypothetical protein
VPALPAEPMTVMELLRAGTRPAAPIGVGLGDRQIYGWQELPRAQLGVEHLSHRRDSEIISVCVFPCFAAE